MRAFCDVSFSGNMRHHQVSNILSSGFLSLVLYFAAVIWGPGSVVCDMIACRIIRTLREWARR